MYVGEFQTEFIYLTKYIVCVSGLNPPNTGNEGWCIKLSTCINLV